MRSVNCATFEPIFVRKQRERLNRLSCCHNPQRGPLAQYSHQHTAHTRPAFPPIFCECTSRLARFLIALKPKEVSYIDPRVTCGRLKHLVDEPMLVIVDRIARHSICKIRLQCTGDCAIPFGNTSYNLPSGNEFLLTWRLYPRSHFESRTEGR